MSNVYAILEAAYKINSSDLWEKYNNRILHLVCTLYKSYRFKLILLTFWQIASLIYIGLILVLQHSQHRNIMREMLEIWIDWYLSYNINSKIISWCKCYRDSDWLIPVQHHKHHNIQREMLLRFLWHIQCLERNVTQILIGRHLFCNQVYKQEFYWRHLSPAVWNALNSIFSPKLELNCIFCQMRDLSTDRGA